MPRVSLKMKNPAITRQGGSVMLEGLIGILIFSIGIIGLISLQAASIKSSADAQYRTEAALHANELIGQMWISNKAALAANFGGAGSCGSGGASYKAWCLRVVAAGSGLPGATAPTVAVAAGNLVTITITWRPPGATGGAHQYMATTQVN